MSKITCVVLEVPVPHDFLRKTSVVFITVVLGTYEELPILGSRSDEENVSFIPSPFIIPSSTVGGVLVWGRKFGSHRTDC